MNVSEDAPKGLLDGVKVLDFGRYIAAPLCAALLADLGADVIRVEPSQGASDREVMPVGEAVGGALYLQMNRNKRSLAIDFARLPDQPMLRALVATADVVVVNMPPRQLAKAGLDFDTLRGLRPDIILTSVTAYSTKGASRDVTGFDGTGQALSGAMHITGSGEIPTRAAVSYVDYSTGIAAAYATLAALYRKARTGEGQQVEISLLKTALAIMNPILIEAATGARHRVATGNRSPISGPSDAFETRDGWVMIQVIGDAMFARLADVIGKPTLANAPEYASDIKRGENGAALSDVVAAWCREKTSGEVMGILSAARIPCVPILGPAEALMSPEIRGGGYFSGSDPANAPLVASLADIAGTVPVRPAPALGEHNREILEELSMT